MLWRARSMPGIYTRLHSFRSVDRATAREQSIGIRAGRHPAYKKNQHAWPARIPGPCGATLCAPRLWRWRRRGIRQFTTVATATARQHGADDYDDVVQ